MIKHILCFFCAAVIAVAAESDRASIVVQAGHTARVNAIAADTNRDLVATASNDYTVRLWKITPPGAGTLLRVLTGHTGFVEDVAFNINDEHQIASCSRDMTLRFWNVVTGKGQRIDLSDRPSCVAYRPNSNIVAVGSSETPQVSFYDANNGKSTDRPFTTASGVTRVAYSENGELLVCGMENGKIEVHDARTKSLIRTVVVSKSKVVFVGFRRNSVVAISSDGTCALIPEESDAVTKKLTGYVLHASISPLHDTLYVVTDAPSVVRIPLSTMEATTLQLSAKQIDAVVSTKRGDVLAYGETDAQRYSWFLQQHGQLDFTSIRTFSDIQNTVAFSHDASLLAVGTNSGSVTVWDLKRPRTPVRFDELGFKGVRSLTFGPGDSTLIVGGFGGVWMVTIDLTTMRAVNTLRGDRDAAYVGCVLSSHAWVLDARTNELVSANTSGTNRTIVARNVRFASLSEDQSKIVVLIANEGAESGTVDSIAVYDAGTRELKSIRKTSAKLISCISAPGNGSHVVCGTLNGELLAISASDGKVISERRPSHLAAVNSVFNGNHLTVSAGNDAAVRIWSTDFTSKPQEKVLRAHSGQVRSAALSPDGKLLASASNDGTVCLSELGSPNAEPKVLYTLVSLEGEWAVFSNDGHFDASESAMRLLKVVNKLESFPIGSLRDSLYVPHLLTGKEEQIPVSTVLMSLPSPPTIQITDPVMTQVVETAQIVLSYSVTSTVNGLQKVRVHDNDKLVSVSSNENTSSTPRTESTPVELVKGANHIRVVVLSADGLEAEDTVTIVYTPKEPPKPKMYIVAVGINQYKNPDYALSYARNDAESVINALKKSAPEGTNVEVAQIFDEDADVDEVEDALENVQEHARPEDSFIFYYAGHGAVLKEGDNSSYCFALHDVTNVNDAKNLKSESLLADTLRSYLLRIKAVRQSVIIDACYSGLMMQSFSESDNARYVAGIQRSTGATVMASVLPDKRAKEVNELKHGLFTYAIVKGLEGAARDSDGEVTLFSLLNYITKTMPTLCKQTGFAYQQPVIRYEGAAQSFVLSVK